MATAKKRAAFGFPGIPALLAAIVCLVPSCHNFDGYINPDAFVNETKLTLTIPDSDYDLRGSRTLVVTLRPRAARYGARIEWSSYDYESSEPCDGIVLIMRDSKRPLSGEFGENGRATIRIVGYSKGRAKIRARVIFEGGPSINLETVVEVRDDRGNEEDVNGEAPGIT